MATSESFDPATALMEAYECAKNSSNWNKVLSSLMIHPEWLTKIPDGRRWSMLHQIVYSGNIVHLNEVLALQITNQEFHLLCETSDHKTVREIATERRHLYSTMMRRIEQFIILDQLLNYGKKCQWESLRELVRQHPDIVNEKPPYRRYYLVHHLAFVGQLNIFKELSNICQFKLDLLANNKTINQIAREHKHEEFAKYIETLNPNLIPIAQNNNQTTPMTIESDQQTVNDYIKVVSTDNFIKTITCCITGDIFHDPVLAADGFTYEREAILTWFQQSNRSPMTNQELDNLEVKPNYAIKSIIESLHNDKHLSTKSAKK